MSVEAESDVAWASKCYTMNGSAQVQSKIMAAVFQKLQASGVLATGYPRFGKIEVIGEYWGPHTYRSVPVASLATADSIILNEGLFITFRIWGLNTRGIFAADAIYLLQEQDEDAVREGMRGLQRYRYIEISRESFLFGSMSGDRAVEIVSVVREALVESGCQEVVCR